MARPSRKRREFYFRIELSGTGRTKAEAWADAIRAFNEDPGTPPPTEAERIKELGPHDGQPMLGSVYTIDTAEDN